MKNSKPTHVIKRKRRRGRLAQEIADEVQCSVYMARMALEILTYCPRMADPVIRGEGTLAEAVFLIRHWGLRPPIKRRKKISVSKSAEGSPDL
jgi:hypothetical protein